MIAADLFAIGVIKQPFGGLGQNIFNPAAGGVAFAVLTWSDSVFRYPVPIESLGNAAARAGFFSGCFTAAGSNPNYPFTDIFLGIYPGPMGGTGVLILLACFGYLVIRKTISWRPTAAFLGTAHSRLSASPGSPPDASSRCFMSSPAACCCSERSSSSTTLPLRPSPR